MVSGTDELSDKIARYLRLEGYQVVRLEGAPTDDMDPLSLAGVWAGGTVLQQISTVEEPDVTG